MNNYCFYEDYIYILYICIYIYIYICIYIYFKSGQYICQFASPDFYIIPGDLRSPHWGTETGCKNHLIAKIKPAFELLICFLSFIKIPFLRKQWRLLTILKNKQKSVWSNVFWYVKVRIFRKCIQYVIQWDKAQMLKRFWTK